MAVVTDVKIKPIKLRKDKSFSAIILKKSSVKNGKLLGKEAEEWVQFACGHMLTKIVEFDASTTIFDLVKEHINMDTDYTFILLSTTPLLEKNDISTLKDYASFKEIGVCKLPVGYIVNNRYFMDSKEPQIDSVYTGDIDNFYIVENKKQYKYALGVLQERVNNYYMEAGVEILKPSSVYIEAEVEISQGVILHPNVSLKGNTSLGENAIIKDGAVIENSQIGDGTFVGSSVIVNSVVGDAVCIASFCEITKSKIGDGAMIESNCNILKYKVKKREKICSGSVLGGTNDSSSRAR